MPAKPKLDEESPVVAHRPVVLRRSLDLMVFAFPVGLHSDNPSELMGA